MLLTHSKSVCINNHFIYSNHFTSYMQVSFWSDYIIFGPWPELQFLPSEMYTNAYIMVLKIVNGWNYAKTILGKTYRKKF